MEKLYIGIAQGIRKSTDIQLLNAKVKTYNNILHRMSITTYPTDNLKFAAKQKRRYETLLYEATTRLQELGYEQK